MTWAPCNVGIKLGILKLKLGLKTFNCQWTGKPVTVPLGNRQGTMFSSWNKRTPNKKNVVIYTSCLMCRTLLNSSENAVHRIVNSCISDSSYLQKTFFMIQVKYWACSKQNIMVRRAWNYKSNMYWIQFPG